MRLLREAWQRHRWLRFLVTGGINTGFSYGVYALLVYCGLNYALSNLCSLVLGILFSFRTQAAFVFQDAARGLFMRYVMVWTILYVSNILMIGALIRLGANAYSAGAMAIVPTAVLSYFLQKSFVFTGARQA
jgi:putative flippase GtrA